MSSTLELEMIQRELLLNQLTFNLNQSVSIQQEAVQMLSQVNSLSSFEQVQSVLQQVNQILNAPPAMQHLNTQISLALHHNQIAQILSSSINFQNSCASPAIPQILSFDNKNSFTESKLNANNDFTQNFKPMMNNSSSRSQIVDEKINSTFNSILTQFPSINNNIERKYTAGTTTSKFTVNNQFVDTLQKITDNFSNTLSQISETNKFPCFPEIITQNSSIPNNNNTNNIINSSPKFSEFNRTDTKNTQDTSFDTNTHDGVSQIDSPSFAAKQQQKIQKPQQESQIPKALSTAKHNSENQPNKKVMDTSPESIEHMYRMYMKGLRSIETMYNLKATDILFDRDFFEKRILNKGMAVLPYFKYKDQEYIKCLYDVLGTTQKKIALLLHLPNRSVGKLICKYNKFNEKKSYEDQYGSKGNSQSGKRMRKKKTDKDDSCHSSQYSSQEEKDSSDKKDSFEKRNNITQTNSSNNNSSINEEEDDDDDELGCNREEEHNNNHSQNCQDSGEKQQKDSTEEKDETDESEDSDDFNNDESNNEEDDEEDSQRQQQQWEKGNGIEENQADSKEGQENEFIDNYQANILAAVKKVEMERRNQAQKEQKNPFDSDNQHGFASKVKIEEQADDSYKRVVKIIKPSYKGNLFSAF